MEDNLAISSPEKFHTPTTIENDHPLEHTWVLWYHDIQNKDWSLDSYQKIYEFSTIEDFWRLYNNIKSMADNYLVLMRKGHRPIWEVPENINGGAWLYKIPKKWADTYWLKFSCYLIGNTIADYTDDLIGISISPKNHNVTLRIWNCNSKTSKEKVNFNMEYTEFQRCTPLYKEFHSNDYHQNTKLTTTTPTPTPIDSTK